MLDSDSRSDAMRASCPGENALRVARPDVTLRSQVVAKLRSAIIDGIFRPGERLVERRLCELTGVSRTSVREALRHLEAEGLVHTIPYKGPVVTAITADEVRQAYEIRGALEGLAAKLFAERASAAQVRELRQILEQGAEAVAAGDSAGHRAAVEAFYALLMRGAGNDMLQAYMSSQRERLGRLRSISLARANRARESLVEKRRIVNAIEARDPGAARRASEAHVANAAAAALDALAADLDPHAPPIAEHGRST